MMKEHMMRELRDHRVNPLNDKLNIGVLDEPGAGGANHVYRISTSEPAGNFETIIFFQNGPINENGINGLTQEVLLAIVADRLRSFQRGDFSCEENAEALRHVKEAMLWLHKRTWDRMQRGVEGTSQK